MEIDLVYLWVNSNDPIWQAKHDAYTGNLQTSTDINGKGRYADNDELKYSLRSVEMYAPWVHHIFIVTDGQTPAWLNLSNPKVSIVDHRDIMPETCLPCFNSTLIEYFIYRIPGLSEHFIYANDDAFINRSAFPRDFFSPDGLPIVKLKRKPLRRIRWFLRTRIRKKPLTNYRANVELASQLVNRKYGTFYSGMPHHNMDAYLKSDYRHVVEEVMPEEVQASLSHRIRNNNDIQRAVFGYTALAEGRGQLRYVTKNDSMYVGIHRKEDYLDVQTCRPLLFCMNDSDHADDHDRAAAKTFLAQRFPCKSRYEK